MNTPIVDFVRAYAASQTVRCHMPGHKGVPLLGCEPLDITEIAGADSLYEAGGIIAQSEANASELFGCATYYSTEGSSQCIRAMLDLVCRYAVSCGKTPRILAGRNAHKVFVGAAALLGIEVEWLYGSESSYLSCAIRADEAQRAIEKHDPVALYVTSPDYLGGMTSIAALASVCRRHGVLLLVDNAHGAYLKFMHPSWHPIDCGADLCCDSAHKTLPALTGAAYLHIAQSAPSVCKEFTKQALARYGSTSPSYLILQSLDAVNAVLAEGYDAVLLDTIARVAVLRRQLTAQGFTVTSIEPLKLTILPRAYGYTGVQLSAALRERGVECEFADPDHVVLMFTPANGEFTAVANAFAAIERRESLPFCPPPCEVMPHAMAARDTLFCARETVAVSEAVGRVLAEETVGCPPAVPIVTCGERITKEAVAAFVYYGITHCVVVKEYP